MITEDYVNFETAKLLKEKGFDVKPFHQYYVSSCGKVFGCTGRELKQETTNRGYKRLSLSINGKHERWSVHRLVALLFIPNPEQKLQVNHIDGNKENNSVTNLEWCCASKNCKHAFRTGLRENQVKGKFGKEHIASRPFVCVETGKIYNCLRELAEDFGEDFSSTSHIARACRYGLLDHGFHWRYYEPNELVKLLFNKGYTKYPESYDGDSWFCYVQMAMKWLREEKDVQIEILIVGTDTWESPTKWIYGFRCQTKDVIDRRNADFSSYEEACEAAIRYCLENLI